jgi:hypothetical protein
MVFQRTSLSLSGILLLLFEARMARGPGSNQGRSHIEKADPLLGRPLDLPVDCRYGQLKPCAA